jgi:hypothetical protein
VGNRGAPGRGKRGERGGHVHESPANGSRVEVVFGEPFHGLGVGSAEVHVAQALGLGLRLSHLHQRQGWLHAEDVAVRPHPRRGTQGGLSTSTGQVENTLSWAQAGQLEHPLAETGRQPSLERVVPTPEFLDAEDSVLFQISTPSSCLFVGESLGNLNRGFPRNEVPQG